MPKPNNGGGDTGGNTIRGSRNDDILVSTSGDDTVKAGSGQDTLVLNGSVWDYDWSHSIEKGIDWKLTDTSGGTGTDLLSSVEILQFDDATIVLGEDLPMEITGVPATFEVTEDETAIFSFIVRDLDDNDVDVKFETGFWHEQRAYGEMSVVTNTESFSNGQHMWGPQSTQRVFDFEFAYEEQGASLAEGEVHIETVTLLVTTTSSEDFFGYTAQETREVTFDVVITGVNDAPTIAGYAEFVTDDTGPQQFDLSALGNDIDSDDDGSTLNYDVISITQNFTFYRFPFEITTDGAMLVVSPDGLPVGLTTDEESWAIVELQTVDLHGASSANTTTVDVTIQGTATGSVRTSVLDANGQIDLSSVTFGVDDVVDYGTQTIFSIAITDPTTVAPMLEYSLGDDSRMITAGTISGFGFNTDQTFETDLGLGADTLVFELTSPTQQFFALNHIDTGWGEDAVILDMTGADEMRFYGTTIETGAQSDQVVIRADAQTNAWFNPDIATGSGHDVVDLAFTHLGTPGELLADVEVSLGSGDDVLNLVIAGDPAIELAAGIDLFVGAGAGNDMVFVDTSTVTGFDYSGLGPNYDFFAEQYHGGINGSIYLGDGDDMLSLALNMPQSGGNSLTVYGDAFGGEDGFDTVTLLNVDAGDVSTASITDYLGRDGIALSTADGQLVELYGVDQLIFADDASWML